jgi:hypothetical protein
VYSKAPDWLPRRLPRTEEADSIYSNPDNDQRGAWLPGDPYANKPYSKGRYTIEGPTGRKFSPPPGRFWRISEEKLRDLDSDGRIWWGPTGDARPSIKRYLTEVSDLVVLQPAFSIPATGQTEDSGALEGQDPNTLPKAQKIAASVSPRVVHKDWPGTGVSSSQ